MTVTVSKIHYDVIGAGPVDHPQKVFKKQIAVWRQDQKVELLEATAHPIGDCWTFTLAHEKELFYMPSYMKVIEAEYKSDDFNPFVEKPPLVPVKCPSCGKREKMRLNTKEDVFIQVCDQCREKELKESK